MQRVAVPSSPLEWRPGLRPHQPPGRTVGGGGVAAPSDFRPPHRSGGSVTARAMTKASSAECGRLRRSAGLRMCSCRPRRCGVAGVSAAAEGIALPDTVYRPPQSRAAEADMLRLNRADGTCRAAPCVREVLCRAGSWAAPGTWWTCRGRPTLTPSVNIIRADASMDDARVCMGVRESVATPGCLMCVSAPSVKPGCRFHVARDPARASWCRGAGVTPDVKC